MGVGIVLAFLAVVIWVPKLSFIQPGGLTDSAGRATAESDLRGHLLQALAGLVLVVGAYFTARTFALNREGQITDRFTRAVEQLASENSTSVSAASTRSSASLTIPRPTTSPSWRC